ncbi:MAG: glutamine synthetase type III, partial [Pseudomonadota bacterium]
MSLRKDAVLASISRPIRKIERPTDPLGKTLSVSEFFGSSTFGLDQIKERLSKDSFEALMNLVHKGVQVQSPVADEIANVV